jgi:hypothetical protein
VRVVILLLLLSAHLAPVVAEQDQWRSDGWLSNLGPPMVADGDEFGCYGIPGMDWITDPKGVSATCRTYVESNIAASRWGSEPVSTYVPEGLSASDHELIADQGFTVHGGTNGLVDGAWRDSADIPSEALDWYNLGRRGGSLELGIANIDTLVEELDAGGLLNMYWQGRIHDSIVRHDRDVVALLEAREDVWFTTWGEAWSYWAIERCNSISHSLSGSTLNFSSDSSLHCLAAEPMRWNVPVTWIIDVNGSEVIDVNLPELSVNDNHAREGWRLDGERVLVSVKDGTNVSINLSESNDYDIIGTTQFFNNKTTALTIAGHATSDLFSWSKRFDGHPALLFTWLVIPQELDYGLSWLPYAGIAVAATSVTVILLLVRREGLGYEGAEAFMPVIEGGGDDE